MLVNLWFETGPKGCWGTGGGCWLGDLWPTGGASLVGGVVGALGEVSLVGGSLVGGSFGYQSLTQSRTYECCLSNGRVWEWGSDCGGHLGTC